MAGDQTYLVYAFLCPHCDNFTPPGRTSQVLIYTVVVMFASTALFCDFSYVSMRSMEDLMHKGAL